MRRISRFLRSRRLAVWLFTGIIAYVYLMTLVPQGDPSIPGVAEWRGNHPGWASLTGMLNLHHAWVWPPFLIAVGLLILSTTICAWERTRDAWALWGRWRRPSSAYLTSLGSADMIPMATHLSHDEALRRVDGCARSRRMRRWPVEGGVWATSRSWGVFGSPLFHWALVGIFVFAALGQATRWEGKLGVVLGHRATDTASSYGRLSEGPLSARRDSTREFEVSAVHRDYSVDGVEIGEAATVALFKDGRLLRRGLVYPNHLLKQDGLLVHMDGSGLGAVLTLKAAGGESLGTSQHFFDYDRLDKSGRIVVRTELRDAAGNTWPVLVGFPLSPGKPGSFKKTLPTPPRLEFSFPGQAGEPTLTAGVGETVEVPGGLGSIVVEDINYYARLFIVDDWSVPWLYAMFVIACVAAAVALLLPPRAVLVTVEPDASGAGSIVRVIPRRRRIDPAFPEMIREAIAKAVDAMEPEAPVEDAPALETRHTDASTTQKGETS